MSWVGQVRRGWSPQGAGRGAGSAALQSPQGSQKMGGLEQDTYHTLATGTDAILVSVAAARPIVDHLVHEDHIPCVF